KVDSGNNNLVDDGASRSWNEWNKQFAPKSGEQSAPNGTLPTPQQYGNSGYGNTGYGGGYGSSGYSGGYGNSGYGGGYGSDGYGNSGYGYSNNGYGYDGHGRYINNNGYENTYNNQSANAEQIEDANKPIPYLMWHRDPWTHRLNLAPYAPGYAAAPQDFLVPPSNYSLFLTSFPSHGNYWRQPRYLGYYDPMPEIVEATPSRSQLILGYPNTPQTQYRDPYSGQPLTYNPAINPESILPVRESLLDRWRRRSLARRAAPLGQFPGQQPILQQPIQSPLFGQPYEQPYEQPYGQATSQQNAPYQYQNEQFQYNQQFQQQPRYARRPPSRFRQGLRERIQRLGIFEALSQRRAGNEIPNNQNYNINYNEAPAFDGTN
ncbi:MAG: hypothetical protein LBL39_05645, partial [Planctomycetaceae bacterium]|nr:hypothetical protein [Planctomycetaceae bacterium]